MNVQVLGWTLLHFLWQGAAVAALLASSNLLLRRQAPQLRYLSASAALLMMALLPVATFRMVADSMASPRPALTPAVQQVALVSEHPPAPSVVASGDAGEGSRQRLLSWVEPALPALVVAWGVGVLFLSLRSVGGWVVAQRLKRLGLQAVPAAVQSTLERLVERLRVSLPVRLFESARVDVPTVVGWLRPALLLPACALTGLSPQQLELILAHELAHIRRHDYLVNLLQTAVETVLFYHPAVWWVSHRMRVEREHCCDDLAVGACGNAVVYARALADLEEQRSGRPALALAATGGSLLERVKRLAGPPPHLSRSSRGVAALLAMAALGTAAGAGSILFAQDAKPVVAQPAKPEMEPVEAEVLLPLVGEEEQPELAEIEDLEEGDFPEVPEPPELPEALEAFEPPDPPEPPEASEVPEVPEAPEPPEPPIAPEPPPACAKSVTAEARGTRALARQRTHENRRHPWVSSEWIDEMAELGYRDLSYARLEALRAQGVSPDFVRGLKEQGLQRLSVSDLVRLRATGVSPEFVRGLKEAGQPELSVVRLMALRASGVDGRFAGKLKALGYGNLTTTRLMALRGQGVGPEYIQGLADLGYPRLSTGMLLALRAQGVTPEYVQELKQAGLQGLSAGALMELRAHGVSGEFVGEMKKAGYGQPTVGQLIALRASGMSISRAKRLRGRL